MTYCQKCGNKIAQNVNFCKKCGQSIKPKTKSFTTENQLDPNLSKALGSLVVLILFIGIGVLFYNLWTSPPPQNKFKFELLESGHSSLLDTNIIKGRVTNLGQEDYDRVLVKLTFFNGEKEVDVVRKTFKGGSTKLFAGETKEFEIWYDGREKFDKAVISIDRALFNLP